MDDKGIIRRLEEDAGMFEIVKVTTFRGYRKNKAGENIEITVKVLDAGEDAGAARYAVEAYSEDGKEAGGNEAETLEEAIPIAHWNKLD